jgi:hypothetical protein
MTGRCLRRILAALVLLALLAPASGQPAGQDLLLVDFSAMPAGPYPAEAFERDWHVAPGESAGITDGRLNIVPDPLDPARNVLRVTYRAGRFGGRSAMTFRAPVPAGQTDLWLQYRVMFDRDFAWVKGGKLPGLGGGTLPTGCVADGEFRGFTTRLMWREGGQAFSYLYYPGKSARCGDYAPLKASFRKGQWHVVMQHVVLNEPGQANGQLQQYLDGALLLDLRHQVWREGEDVTIDGIKMDTFFGGGTAAWAPVADQFAYFDGFRVWSAAGR